VGNNRKTPLSGLSGDHQLITTSLSKANLYFCDGAAQEREAIEASGEPYRPLTEFIITNNPHVQNHTVTSVWAATVRREEYRTAYAELWNSTATSTSLTGALEGMVDVILCPVTPSAVPKIDTARYWGYTAQWNLLDYPAVVFPVSKVGESDEEAEKEKYKPRNERDAYNWELWEEHGAKGYMDAPVSLQLVGRRYEDEKVLEALEVIKMETELPFVDFI
jgi:Asp-tRNA(Asn)/Glu-tRNA(Gln) amidotransferase A subunit family amidase